MLDHGEAKVLITDREFSKVDQAGAGAGQGQAAGDRLRRPGFTRARASGSARSTTRRSSPRAIRNSPGRLPDDEWDAIALNYTSGTTGDPEGRGLSPSRRVSCSRVGNIVTCGMGKHPVYLWTLPMFHCNGWCFPWTISAVAGTHVCLR